jgi:tetratricopeptide (TPR) repeat protein
MSQAYQRGIILFSQKRYDLAAHAFREELSQNPSNALAHAQLALCLQVQRQPKNALAEARQAVRLAAGNYFCHYVLGWILVDLKRYKLAEVAAREAIRLQPAIAENHLLLARVETARGRWNNVLESVRRGLALDPSHAGCKYFETVALINLGRGQAAAEVIQNALAEHPEDASIHASQGWALLHEGRHPQALEQFREALRIAPSHEFARFGMVEALKARFFPYRCILWLMLLRDRHTPAKRVLFLVACYFAALLFALIASQNEYLRPVAGVPFGVLFFGIPLLVFASPFFNFLLSFNRYGRYALSREQRRQCALIAGFFMAAGAVVVIVTTAVLLDGNALAIQFAMLVLPACLTINRRSGKPRLFACLSLIPIVLLGTPSDMRQLLGPSSPWKDQVSATSLLIFATLAAFVAVWFIATLPSNRSED